MMGKLFTLDGERVDLVEFIKVNEFEDAEIAALHALDVGEEYTFGGGAMPITVLRRVQ